MTFRVQKIIFSSFGRGSGHESYPQITDAAAETDPEKHLTNTDQKPFTRCSIPCFETAIQNCPPAIYRCSKISSLKEKTGVGIYQLPITRDTGSYNRSLNGVLNGT